MFPVVRLSCELFQRVTSGSQSVPVTLLCSQNQHQAWSVWKGKKCWISLHSCTVHPEVHSNWHLVEALARGNSATHQVANGSLFPIDLFLWVSIWVRFDVGDSEFNGDEPGFVQWEWEQWVVGQRVHHGLSSRLKRRDSHCFISWYSLQGLKQQRPQTIKEWHSTHI